MTVTTRRPLRRALAVPASIAIVVGALATTSGLLAPEKASAVVCPTLVASPQTYSTGAHCFTVPANVVSIHAVLIGATGGDGLAGSGTVNGAGGRGGHGMQVSGDVAVTGGQVIWVYVGGNGTNGGVGDTFGTGGYNGGAEGGGVNNAGGGGGATDLRTVAGATGSINCGGDGVTDQNGNPSDFLLVAGGGGGGGNGSDDINQASQTLPVSDTADGGNGGSQPGDSSPPSGGVAGLPSGGGGGGAGTGSAGGAGGAGSSVGGNAGAPGSTRDTTTMSGCGGFGGSAGDSQSSGGGGGGGYNGGGGGGGGTRPCIVCVSSPINQSVTVRGGGGGGGGGGSDFHSSAATNVQEAIGTLGPSAIITFTAPTQSLQPLITTPSVGSGGSSLDVGLGLLGIGIVLFVAFAVGIRRPRDGRQARPPA